jgi:tetratricopeptide (TPR) repeat protein
VPKDGININYILDGRVRVSGEDLRIDIKINDGASGKSIWVERFTDVMDEMDNLIIIVRNKVSGFVRNMTSAFAGANYSYIPDSDLSLGELLSKSAHLIQRWDQQSITTARISLKLTIKQAPENSMALAMLASTYIVPVVMGYESIDDHKSQRAIELANKAVSIGKNIDFVFQSRAMIKCFLLKDLTGAKIDCERALKINPYYHIMLVVLGSIEIFVGNAEAGIEQFLEFISNAPEDPMVPTAYSVAAMGYLICGQHEKALQFAREGYELSPSTPTSALFYSAAASNIPEIINSEGFKNMIGQLDLRISLINNFPLNRSEDIELITSRLLAAGLPE